jgi:hypothetical protein
MMKWTYRHVLDHVAPGAKEGIECTKGLAM